MKIDADTGNGKRSKRIRPSTTERGYGHSHQRLRAAVARVVKSGAAVCARCGLPIAPDAAFDLDHARDRLSYLGPSHVRCNRGTASRRTVPLLWSRRWFDNPAVGTEVNLGDGLVEVHLGGGHWETMPASEFRN